jgi:hypothetical protein
MARVVRHHDLPLSIYKEVARCRGWSFLMSSDGRSSLLWYFNLKKHSVVAKISSTKPPPSGDWSYYDLVSASCVIWPYGVLRTRRD